MEEEHLSWAVLKTELGREVQVETGRMGKVWRWKGPGSPGDPEGGVWVEAWRDGLYWTSAAGQGLDPALQYFVSPCSPSHSPAPGPTAPPQQSGDWEMDESVYEAHNVASKTRYSAEQRGASNGILFMSFSSWRWSHYRPG